MGDANQLVAIVGATGTGKSALSLDLAEALFQRGLSAEIVNADAMQLYRGMDIGTAKLPVSERRGIPHHLLDILEVTAEASVASYQTRAREVIAEISARGAVPILVGGSGLYVSSVLFDFQFPGTDAAIRSRLESELAESGPGLMHQRLQTVDLAAADQIGPKNGRRLVRALEVIELTGRPFGSGLPDDQKLWRPVVMLGVRAPRAELVTRLDERVAGMWEAGLRDEVSALLRQGLEHGATASRAIGYAQAIAELQGALSTAEAIASTAALTRKYARRQVGWFNRYPRMTWLEHDDSNRVARALALTLPYA